MANGALSKSESVLQRLHIEFYPSHHGKKPGLCTVLRLVFVIPALAWLRTAKMTEEAYLTIRNRARGSGTRNFS